MENAVVEKVRVAYSGNLPGLLAAASPVLPDFEKYIARPPDNPSQRIMGCYSVVATETETDTDLFVLVEFQLPKVLVLNGYSEIIWNFTKTLDSDDFGYFSLNREMDISYPSRPGDAGAGAFIMVQLAFTKSIDSCYN